MSRPDAVPAEHKANAPRSIGCFVLTISDSKTPDTDTSGLLIRERLTQAGHAVVGHAIVRDEPTQSRETTRRMRRAPSAASSSRSRIRRRRTPTRAAS